MGLPVHSQDRPQLPARLARCKRIRRTSKRPLDLPNPEAISADVVSGVQWVLDPERVESMSLFTCERKLPREECERGRRGAEPLFQVLGLRWRPSSRAFSVQPSSSGDAHTVLACVKAATIEIQAPHQSFGRRCCLVVLQKADDHQQQPIRTQATCVRHAIGAFHEPLFQHERDRPCMRESRKQPADHGLTSVPAVVGVLQLDVYTHGASHRVLLWGSDQ
mmetsp:Transcript_68051/g.221566  ORF Transcript_68051/g.221566 Transcript_68051/m.221566 type:complete len:220 (+) Transcript_68051:318-977(+)